MPSDAAALEILSDLIAKARRAGADAADALHVESQSVTHDRRLGQTEKVERAESHDLGLRVFIGRRQAIVSSTDLTPSALGALVERAVAMARVVPEDKFCGIADAGQVARAIPSLDLEDPVEPSEAALAERARLAEDAARSVAGVTNSEGAGSSWGVTRVRLAASNGFAQAYGRTRQGVGVSVIAGEGTGMERDDDHTSAVHGSDLEPADAVGRRAGERAVRRLNPRKPRTAQVPVVFDPRIANSLVGHLAGAINGASIARGVSFLKDKMGQPVFAKGISIIDDPHRPRGLASRPFDGEGIPNQRRAIIEDGVLTTWLLDLASARQLGLATTGHAARGTSGPPSPSTTNVHMEPGNVSPESLIGSVDDGLYVTDLMGFGINGVTGDYSRGASGFWIEKGRIAYPVSEATIAGNLKDMFLNLTPANDLVFKYGTNAPTLRVDGMTVAGQ
jgi:PmbA protein